MPELRQEYLDSLRTPQRLPHNSTSLPVFLTQEGREALFLLPFFAISSPETHLKQHFRRGYSRKKAFSEQKCTF